MLSCLFLFNTLISLENVGHLVVVNRYNNEVFSIFFWHPCGWTIFWFWTWGQEAERQTVHMGDRSLISESVLSLSRCWNAHTSDLHKLWQLPLTKQDMFFLFLMNGLCRLLPFVLSLGSHVFQALPQYPKTG